jgi:hypothetical protein
MDKKVLKRRGEIDMGLIQWKKLFGNSNDIEIYYTRRNHSYCILKKDGRSEINPTGKL